MCGVCGLGCARNEQDIAIPLSQETRALLTLQRIVGEHCIRGREPWRERWQLSAVHAVEVTGSCLTGGGKLNGPDIARLHLGVGQQLMVAQTEAQNARFPLDDDWL